MGFRKLRDEIFIQVRIKSEDLDKYTLSELAHLLIAVLEITLIVLKTFYDLTIGLVRGLEWLADGLERLPYLPFRLMLSQVRFAPPMG